MALSLRHACAVLLLLPLTACDGQRPDTPAELRNQVAAGKQVGTWTYRYPDGALRAEGAWADDLQTGPWRWWYADGSPQHAGSYGAGGLRSGRWRSWHPSGHLASEGAYRDDRADGLWRHWHADGVPAAEGRWDHGVRQGFWVLRDEAGRPASAGLYVQGLAVGPWLRWKDGVAAASDLGAPAGAKAAWASSGDGASWTLIADGWNARLAWDQGWVLRQAEVAGTAQVPAGIAAFAAPLAALAALPQPPAPPTPPVASVPLVKDAPLASVAPAAPAQLELAISAPSAEPAVLPGLWTRLQEGNAGKLLRLYTSGEQPGDLYDTGRQAATGDPYGRTLVGRPLAQTRFLAHGGGVVDITRSGKPTVLVVMRGFSGQVCLYCSTQTAALSDQHQRFRDAGAELVVVYPGPTESVPAFIQAVQSLRKDPPPMTVALDVSLLLVRSLGIEDNLARPTSLVLRPDGKVAWAYVGSSPADRPSVEDLLAALPRAKS